MTEVPINIVISSQQANSNGQKVVRTLDDIKKSSNEAKKSTTGFSSSLDDLSSSSSSALKSIESFSAKTSSMGSVVKTAKNAVLSLAAAFSARELVNAAREMQNLEARLKTMTGSAQAANQAMEYLRVTANRQGIEINSLAEGFARLLPSVKSGRLSFQELNQILTLSNDNIKAFGLTTSEVDGLFLGLSQTFGSGTVTLEDLRQVTDRLPGSLDAIARSMGKTVGQFKDMISQGNFTAEMLKGPLLNALRENEGAAESLGDTFDSQMARMQNAFNDLALAIADTGLLDALSFIVERLTSAIDALTLGILFLRLGFNKLQGDNEELNDVMDQFFNKLDKINGVAGVATNKLDELSGNGGSGGFTKLTKEALAAAKAQEILNQKLNDIYRNQNHESLTLGMEEGVKRVRDFQFELEKLSESVGGFNETQQQMADILVENEEYIVKKKEAIEELNKSMVDARKASKESFDQLRKDTEDYLDSLDEPYKNAMREVQLTISDTFEGVFSGSIDDAGDAAESIKNIFIKMAAELATIQLLNLTGLNDVFNPSSLSGLSSSQSFSSSSSQNLVNQADSLISQGSSLLGSSLSSSAFDSLAAESLPSIFGVAQGPTVTGQAGYGTGLLSSNGISASSIANPVAGFAGNYTGQQLFSQGRYSGIGGTLGGAVGAYFGGPIGGYLGALAGNAIGGLFGPDAEIVASNFGGTIGNDGNFDNSVIRTNGGGDPKLATALSDQVGYISQSLVNSGIDVSNQIIQGGVDDGKGFFGIGDYDYLDLRDGKYNAITFDPNGGEDAVNQAMAELTLRLVEVSDISEDLADNLNKVKTEGSDAQSVLDDINFIMNFEEIFNDAEDSINQIELTIDQMNSSFDDMNETMVRLGYTVEEINRLEDERNKQLDEYKNSIVSNSITGYLDSIDPSINQLFNLNSNYKSQLSDFTESGINTTFLTKQYQNEQEKLINQINQNRINSLRQEESATFDLIESSSRLSDEYMSLSRSLEDSISNLRTGNLSPLSDEQKLNEARNNFNNAANKAALGDIDAALQLDSLANEFLSLSRDYNASNDQFVEDFNSVEEALNKAKDTADRQVNIQEEIANSAREQIGVLEEGFEDLTNAVNQESISDQVASLNSSNPLPGVTQEELTSLFPNTANSIYLQNQDEIKASGLNDTFLNLLGSYTRGVNGGSGRHAIFLNDNPSINNDLIQVARQLGIPGFAEGGNLFSNQVALVGERKPEILKAGSNGGKIIPLENGSDIEQRLNNLERESKSTNMILQYGFKQMLDSQNLQIEAIQDNTRAVTRK